ncbi:MAG TPA: BolA family protein [Rhodanobacter sp.]|jgi:BolA protein|nr:BolA family protein [Rhodanobacter sp.]
MTGNTRELIQQRLQAAFAPTELDVVDEGHKHVGHPGEGQGHFHVRMVSAAFAGCLPIKRQRMVYAELADLMGHGIHALSMDVSAAQGQ